MPRFQLFALQIFRQIQQKTTSLLFATLLTFYYNLSGAIFCFSYFYSSGYTFYSHEIEPQIKRYKWEMFFFIFDKLFFVQMMNVFKRLKVKKLEQKKINNQISLVDILIVW